MNRREFSRLIAGSAVSALLRPGLQAQHPRDASAGETDAADELYRRALVVDANSGPPYEGPLPLPPADLDLVRASGVSVVKWSLGGIDGDFAEAVKEIAYAQQMIEIHPDCFLPVRVPGDLERAKREGRLGVILSFESVDMLEGRLDRLELFRRLGVRVMQLSYNRRSPFAAGVLEPAGGGLTALGHDAVKQMNALGIVLDLSHANAATTTDAIAASAKPVVITHAGCAALHPHARNKTDDQMRALADRGGVMGIYDLMYLTASPRQPTVEDYLAHVEHALKVMGEDHVGVGSDVSIKPFDTSPQGLATYQKYEDQRQQSGLAAAEEDRPPYVVGLNTPRRIEVITDRLLKRGHPARVVEKVIGANFARAFREIWTG